MPDTKRDMHPKEDLCYNCKHFEQRRELASGVGPCTNKKSKFYGIVILGKKPACEHKEAITGVEFKV